MIDCFGAPLLLVPNGRHGAMNCNQKHQRPEETAGLYRFRLVASEMYHPGALSPNSTLSVLPFTCLSFFGKRINMTKNH